MVNNSIYLTFSLLFSQSRTPSHRLVLPTFRIALPSLVTSSQTHPELCLLGDAKACQVNDVAYPSHLPSSDK